MFPVLMKLAPGQFNDGLFVVLATGLRKGTVVMTENINRPIGFSANPWINFNNSTIWVPLGSAETIILNNQ